VSKALVVLKTDLRGPENKIGVLDHVQVTAISRALKVNVKIAYLDGRSDDGRVEFVTFNNAINESETPLTLIYRSVIFSGQGLIVRISECPS
jgi:Peptidase C65 Otubain